MKRLFPLWLEMFTLRPTKVGGFPVFAGYRRYGRVIRGTINALERAYVATLKATSESEDDAAKPSAIEDEVETEMVDQEGPEYSPPHVRVLPATKWITARARAASGKLGRVKINYGVAIPPNRPAQDVLRNWVDPDKTISSHSTAVGVAVSAR